MAKSAYSILLSDEVVHAIDLAATRQGMSRSALINHVLAEHVGFSTHEARSRDILSVVEEMMKAVGLRPSFSPGGALTLRTALQYKYNPQLSYVVQLHEGGSTFGELQVVLRSQNEALLTYMQLFFQLWDALEQRNLPTPPPRGFNSINARRYLRVLRRPSGLMATDAGETIAAYVNLMDDCLRSYFANIDEAEAAVAATEQTYRKGFPRLGEGIHF